jgi:hypothetical protein
VTEDIVHDAVSALRTAAERLGVDPRRLAAFLADGRIADVLEAVSRPHIYGPRRVLGLAEMYLEFLDAEIAIQEGHRPDTRSRLP